MNVFQEQSILLYALVAFGFASNVLLICILTWVKRIAEQLGWVDPVDAMSDETEESVMKWDEKTKPKKPKEPKETWTCSECGLMNITTNELCYRCGTKKKGN